MAKKRQVYVCADCSNETLKWMGRCPQCGAWNTLAAQAVEKNSGGTSATVVSITDAKAAETTPRLPSGIGEIDRVLGGGLVPGSVTLLGGAPGIGKSTIVSQVLASLAAKHDRPVLYATGEESVSQTALRCHRLGIDDARFHVACETDVNAVIAAIDELGPCAVAIDSVQTLQGATESSSGTVSQVRASSLKVLEYAKKHQVPVVLIGHVTKGGDIAGPKLLEHMVDTVLYFADDNTSSYRVVRCHKNRFGSTHEIGVFEMKGAGLDPVENPSAALLSQRKQGVPGSCVVASLEGSRPLLVEVQSLVVPSHHGIPRRVSAGVDNNRVALLLAILSQRAQVNALSSDVFVSLAGGLRISVPDLDLGIILAIASSVRDKALPNDLVCFGEVGLSGEVRGVPQIDARLHEAAALGFSRCIMAESAIPKQLPKVAKMNVIGVPDVKAALLHAFVNEA